MTRGSREEADFFLAGKIKPLNGFRKFLQDSLCVELCVVNPAQNAASQFRLLAARKNSEARRLIHAADA